MQLFLNVLDTRKKKEDEYTGDMAFFKSNTFKYLKIDICYYHNTLLDELYCSTLVNTHS